MAINFFKIIFHNHFSSFHVNKSMNPKSCRSPSTTTNDNSAIVSYDFDNPINQADEDCEEEDELPEESTRLLKQEENVIQSYEESMEMVNLGTNEEAKEV